MIQKDRGRVVPLRIHGECDGGGKDLKAPDRAEYRKEKSKRWNGDVGGGGD